MDTDQPTTPPEGEGELQEALDAIEKAHDMVSALCQPRDTEGARRWLMSIPARPDYDPDLVIGGALAAAEKLLRSRLSPSVADEEKLLPCPFCGGTKASTSPPTCRPETPYNPIDRLYPIVRCNDCGAETNGKDEDYRGETAIAAWNRRSRLSTERPEPDGWITKDDVERVRDPQVPNINVWAEPDEGDLPVFIGTPPRGEPREPDGSELCADIESIRQYCLTKGIHNVAYKLRAVLEYHDRIGTPPQGERSEG